MIIVQNLVTGSKLLASTSTVQLNPTAGAGSYTTGLPRVTAETPTLQIILELIFGTIAAVAIIIVIIAAITMAVEAGNKDTVEKMRNTLIYAAVGLIISLSAFAIVGLVLSKL